MGRCESNLKDTFKMNIESFQCPIYKCKKTFQFDDAQNCFDEDVSFSLCEHVEFYSVLSAIFIKFHRFKRPSLTTAVLRVRPCRARKVAPCSFWIHAGVYGGVW